MKNILFTLLAICLLYACYDDKSTLPQFDFPTIVSDRQGEEEYLIATLGEEFNLTIMGTNGVYLYSLMVMTQPNKSFLMNGY